MLSLEWGVQTFASQRFLAGRGVPRWTKTCVELVNPASCLWCEEQLACSEEFWGFTGSVNDWGKKKGVPQSFFFFLQAADWLMLLSGQRVPGEHEEPCVICGGFYKQRQAWKWWDEILAKGRNDKSIRNAFHLSLLLFSPPFSEFGGTAVAITLLYVAPFTHMQHVGDRPVRQVCGSEMWTWTCQICLMVKLQLDALPGVCVIFVLYLYCQRFYSYLVLVILHCVNLLNF